MKTVYLNAAYFPGDRAACRRWRPWGSCSTAATRRSTATSTDRRARRLHRGAEQLLRPDPAALAAVHDLPVGDGGAGQDLRAARRVSPTWSTSRTPWSCRALRGEIELRGRLLLLRRGRGRGAGRCATSTSHVPPGQTVALVGATGAGKSTLAKLVARFYDPTEGRVLVDGARPARRRAASRCARSSGIVPQEGFLFSGTIRDNIAFGRPDATDEEVAAAAAAVGADAFIEALPERLRHRGRRARLAALSAGQRQLVAFARALIADPRILVLDEATSNVDIHTETRIEEGLRRLLAGRTAIVIAHRLSTIRRAGQIVVLEQRPDRRAGHPRRAARRPGRLLAAAPGLGVTCRCLTCACGAGTPSRTPRTRSTGWPPKHGLPDRPGRRPTCQRKNCGATASRCAAIAR